MERLITDSEKYTEEQRRAAEESAAVQKARLKTSEEAAKYVGKELAAQKKAAEEAIKLQEKKAQLEPVLDIYNEYVQTKANNDYLNAVYAQTQNNNAQLKETIEELEEKMPSNIEVNTLTVTPETLALTFRVKTKEEVAMTIMQLRTFKSFSNVVVASVNEVHEEETGDVYVESQALCTYGTNPWLEPDETEQEAAADEAAAGEAVAE